MIFIQKTDTSLVSIALPLRRANFSKRKNFKSVLLMGVSVSEFVCLFVCFFRVDWYSDTQADVMISSIDVYVLTISTFLSMIVAVVVAMKALSHLISPSCPQPLFQSGVKRKVIDMTAINIREETVSAI